MVFQTIADSPLQAYSKLLMKLHRLIAAGEGDSDDADAVRDMMDGPWYQLAPAEQDIAKQLSADLYGLHEEPNGKHPHDTAAYSRELAAELSIAQSRGEYLRALRLMQERPGDISAEWTAILRGIFYRELGLPEIGLLFLEHAAQTPADSESARRKVIGFLWEHMNVESAITDATEGHLAKSEW